MIEQLIKQSVERLEGMKYTEEHCPISKMEYEIQGIYFIKGKVEGRNQAISDIQAILPEILREVVETSLEEVEDWAHTQVKVHKQLAQEIVGNPDWHTAQVRQSEELIGLLSSLKETKLDPVIQPSETASWKRGDSTDDAGDR